VRAAEKSNYSVMIVEDSPDDILLYKKRLSAVTQANFDISEYNNVKSAKNAPKSKHFDCYIVDYQLPGENGLDFVRYLLEERSEISSDAAIIVVTGCGSEELAAEAFKLGAHEYLTKAHVLDGDFGRPVLNAIERAHFTSQIKDYQDKLKKSNSDLSNFAHTAAHDLKAPLRRILSYCEIMQEDAAERLNDDDKKMMERMEINARRMQNLVENLLSFSLIGYDVEKKHETDLNDIVQDVIEDLGVLIQETDAKIEYEDLPKLAVYPVRMNQLFSNLISNAIKYRSDKAPHIVIKAKTEGEYTTFSVSDNGSGIPKSRLSYIFEDFKRLYNNEDVDGSGLGLSICKKIVERHDGKIWAESDEGQGATFYFTIKSE